eukprot:PhM_4_TR8289/c1_g1_i1/m.92587/K20028/ZDHHC2_15_20; palmitoyltransferase ZDHHC2/15/20
MFTSVVSSSSVGGEQQQRRGRRDYTHVRIVSLIIMWFWGTYLHAVVFNGFDWATSTTKKDASSNDNNNTNSNNNSTSTLVVGFHAVLVMFMCSYVCAVCIRPGRVPERFSLNGVDDGRQNVDDDDDTDDRNGRGDERVSLLSMRSLPICVKCHSYKPPRTHHCSACGECVLMYDHHCPWIAQCVGHRNRKYFLLLCFYAIAVSGVFVWHTYYIAWEAGRAVVLERCYNNNNNNNNS